jgi:hypothetical protein
MFFELTIAKADAGTLTVRSFADSPRQIRSYVSHGNFPPRDYLDDFYILIRGQRVRGDCNSNGNASGEEAG